MQMNRKAWGWAAGLALLGAIMLAFGIHDIVGFHASRGDLHQSLTLGQMVDIVTASVLLVLAALIATGQVRAHRRATRHRRWLKNHPV